MVRTVANNEPKDRWQDNPWKMFAFFSGATLQLGICVVVFGFLGHLMANRFHMPWITAAGALFGVLVGASGLAFLAKQILGDKR